MLVSIGEAALLVGVCPATLRRWEREGKITACSRTVGGHRRYRLEYLKETLGLMASNSEKRIAVGYARVSSSDQRDDLQRQLQAIRCVLKKSSQPFELIADMGSGLNFKKRGLTRLLHLIITGQVSKLVVTHKDRLLRFGSELIFSLCRHFATDVVIMYEDEKQKDDHIQLSKHVIELMVVFSARLYGKRSHENRRKRLKEAAS